MRAGRAGIVAASKKKKARDADVGRFGLSEFKGPNAELSKYKPKSISRDSAPRSSNLSTSSRYYDHHADIERARSSSGRQGTMETRGESMASLSSLESGYESHRRSSEFDNLRREPRRPVYVPVRTSGELVGKQYET